MFSLSAMPIDISSFFQQVADPRAGAVSSFIGVVRNENNGRPVLQLEYQAYTVLAEKEGGRIIEESLDRFDIIQARCSHRTGLLDIGETAIVVVVSAAHRGAAFDACRFIVDQAKSRVPIWKREYFSEGRSDWVNAPGATDMELPTDDDV